MESPVIIMIERSGWVARTVLILLGIFSVVSWAIIFNRYFYLRKMNKLNKLFKIFFAEQNRISYIEKADPKFLDGPLGMLGREGYKEFTRIVSDAQLHTGVKDWSFYLQNQFLMTSERLHTLVSSIIARLDKGVFLLAITSSVAPFLGLFGTVWGIMDSFYAIGNQGSASLPVVAPGIAEALITTAIGLAAAIPAVFFYNIFLHRAQRIENEMDEFSENILVLVKHELFDLLYSQNPEQVSLK